MTSSKTGKKEAAAVTVGPFKALINTRPIGHELKAFRAWITAFVVTLSTSAGQTDIMTWIN